MDKTEADMQQYIINRYDGLSFLPEFLEYYGSGFMNFGYWEEHTATQKDACENLMERLLAMLPDKSGTILDVACGKGETTAYLTRFFAPERITAINISEKQLEAARRTAPGCRFMKSNATAMEFGDESFDNIICVEAAFHFYTRETFFNEALRVLKPGGRIVLSDILLNLEGERGRESRTEKNFLPDPAAYRELMEKTGFAQVQVIDATEESWRRHFRYLVTFFHRKFLKREIDQARLQQCLFQTYRRVGDTEFYLLAAGTKPGVGEIR